MPKSRTRDKKPRALRGIPASVLAKAPPGFTAGQKALWAHAYLCGSTGRPYTVPRGTPIEHQLRRAHWLGREFSTSDEARAFADGLKRDQRRSATSLHPHRIEIVPQKLFESF